MNTQQFREKYWMLAKSGHYLEVQNPFHFPDFYYVGSSSIRINEEDFDRQVIAFGTSSDTDLDKDISRFLVFIVSYDAINKILWGEMSLREAFDNHSEDIAYIIDQRHYSSSTYMMFAFSRKDIPSQYVEELEKGKVRAEKLKY